MSDLATLRGYVQRDVDDTGAVVFATADVDRGLRRALREYSVKLPQIKVANLAAAAGRVQSLSTCTGLIDVQRVWFPYYSTEPDLLPTWVPFEVQVAGSLFVAARDAPAVGDTLRVYYTAWHTIKDLDSATATSVPGTDQDLVCFGAAGYACQAQARGAVGVVNVSGYTPVHWLRVAEGLLVRFEAGLYAAALRDGVRGSGWSAMG